MCQQQLGLQLDLFDPFDFRNNKSRQDYERYVNKQIGALIRTLRRQHGLTQKALGDMLGLTYQQIQKYEHGKSSISIGKLFLGLRAIDYSAKFNVFEESKWLSKIIILL